MYLDALEFLDEERDAWAPFEALAELTDDQLSIPVAEAHGWTGRQLMSHLVAWQENAMSVAKELAVDETSPTKLHSDAEWEERGGEAVNAALDAAWAELPFDEVRKRFATVPGELRGYLTVVPETRWLKHADHQRFFSEETTEHYEDHAADLRAILAATRP
jgi:Mycothiol maleylpyruvate isomerase N-terminal domain